MYKLTVAIPSIVERKEQFEALLTHLYRIAPIWVEIIDLIDNKTISIGSKRQQLLETAKGEYIVMVDDDDTIPDYYFDKLLPALEQQPDCVGYIEQVGEKNAIHSKRFKHWGESKEAYHRTPFCKDPIRTELARQVGFKDMRYGEDHDFAKRLYPLLKTEVFIDEIMYIYNQPKRLSKQEHKKRYGIG